MGLFQMLFGKKKKKDTKPVNSYPRPQMPRGTYGHSLMNRDNEDDEYERRKRRQLEDNSYPSYMYDGGSGNSNIEHPAPSSPFGGFGGGDTGGGDSGSSSDSGSCDSGSSSD